ncbi:hypothetical protein [Cereibacter johrii]|uniref:hypothetical protein n=1 Tax=Cereibacter johrii TaxID=445629 RepID=UPI000DD2FDFF|nr:hypothetical protein [Cereibacter johrii]
MEEPDWAEYARLQVLLDRTPNAYRAAGVEAAMADLIEKIGNGEPPDRRQVDNLVTNRVGRERRRRAVVLANSDARASEPAATGAAESQLILAKCEEICGKEDFALLVRHAQGFSFGDLAISFGSNPNALKIKAFRAKKKIVHLAA